MRLKAVCVFLVLSTLPAFADGDARAVLRDSVGAWQGELYYLDYQSGRRFAIPVRIEAEITPDGATLTRRFVYTDPDNLVYAINVLSVNDDGELVEAYFRDNNGEMFRHRIDEVTHDSAVHWKVVYSQRSEDDGRPARIRHTLQRVDDRLSSSKEVRFLDVDDAKYLLRNGLELKLTHQNPK